MLITSWENATHVRHMHAYLPSKIPNWPTHFTNPRRISLYQRKAKTRANLAITNLPFNYEFNEQVILGDNTNNFAGLKIHFQT